MYTNSSLSMVLRTVTRPRPREAARSAALQVEEIHHSVAICRDVVCNTTSFICLEFVAIPKPCPALERNVFCDFGRFLAHIENTRPLLDLLAKVLWIKRRVCCAMKSLELRTEAAIRRVCVAHESCPLGPSLNDLASGTRVTPDIEAVAGKASEWYTRPCASCSKDIWVASDEHICHHCA